MRKEEIQVAIAEEVIIRKIYSIRGKQVMLSQDLAELYEVGTRVLNQHVKYLPYAFTEHGILMLSSVLNSKRADKVNMMIIDTFIKLREILFINKDVIHQLEKVQSRLEIHDNQILVILEYLKQFEQMKQEKAELKNRPRIGFKTSK
jgi:hypothetical protein